MSSEMSADYWFVWSIETDVTASLFLSFRTLEKNKKKGKIF